MSYVHHATTDQIPKTRFHSTPVAFRICNAAQSMLSHGGYVRQNVVFRAVHSNLSEVPANGIHESHSKGAVSLKNHR